MANWEKKSSYLLREIVKFRTYIDSLEAAEKGKQRVYEEREAYQRQGEVVEEGEVDVEMTPRPNRQFDAERTPRVG
jgi:hypothetical protein